MKLAWGIVHKKSSGKWLEIERDRNGRYEIYSYEPKYSNHNDYKTIRVRICVSRTKVKMTGGKK